MENDCNQCKEIIEYEQKLDERAMQLAKYVFVKRFEVRRRNKARWERL